MRKAVNPKGAAAPSAPYSPAIVANGFIYVSGQGPLDAKTGVYTPSTIQAETKLVFENIKSILDGAGSSLEKVVKVNVFLRDIRDFAAMNEVYATYFTQPFPARTTVQAGALPRNFAVEIECVAMQ
jgi:2-iminobutanoate/2-iminopropanoate deaminase